MSSSRLQADLINILLVDDRQDGLMALEAVLNNPEYNLVRASSGEQALACVLETQFALILMDVQMPGMDGFETASLMKQREKSRDIPIIFVTAISKETTFVYKGYRAGAVDYIFKPFDPQILQSKVTVFIELYRKNRMILHQAEQLRESELRARLQQLAALEIENLNRYRNLADSIPHIVWKCQPDGTLDYCNKVWASYTGLSLEQSIGKGWQKAFYPEDLKQLFNQWEDALSENRPFESECRIRSALDGGYKWHLFRAVPELAGPVDPQFKLTEGVVDAPENRVVAWVTTGTDIDLRKKMEEDLVTAKNDAMKASVAKTNFLANMSHEIRTPLGIVLGYSELMSVPHLAQSEREQYLGTIKRNGELLSDLIGNILDLSKIESGHLEIESKASSLPELLRGILKPLQLKAKQSEINLVLEVKTAIPDFVQTDPTRLRQILFNVVGNALKFTKAGQVLIDVSYAADAHLFTIQVTDSGIGITPAQEQKIFNPFMQADTSTTRQFGGTGLGLSLSRRLARALKGDIRLAWSELGKGSTFEFTFVGFPTANARMIEADQVLNLEDRIEPARAPLPSHILGDIRILLAEDSPDNQLLIGRFLRGAGAEVEVASNGKEAVELICRATQNNRAHDLILMDIQMPILDGYQATVQLRTNGYKMPIIALTAHAFEEERSRCLAAGCNEHLTKPVNRELLIATIKSCVADFRSKNATAGLVLESRPPALGAGSSATI